MGIKKYINEAMKNDRLASKRAYTKRRSINEAKNFSDFSDLLSAMEDYMEDKGLDAMEVSPDDVISFKEMEKLGWYISGDDYMYVARQDKKRNEWEVLETADGRGEFDLEAYSKDYEPRSGGGIEISKIGDKFIAKKIGGDKTVEVNFGDYVDIEGGASSSIAKKINKMLK